MQGTGQFQFAGILNQGRQPFVLNILVLSESEMLYEFCGGENLFPLLGIEHDSSVVLSTS
jgi:hypothetical protein